MHKSAVLLNLQLIQIWGTAIRPAEALGGRCQKLSKPAPICSRRRAPKAKYPGLHSLRHYFASWCANRKADGGLELPLRVVQARMGHATISMTADRYSHLFPEGDDSAELAAAEGKHG
jgi:integrase